LPLGNEKQQQPYIKEVPLVEATEGLKELENQLFLMTIKTMLVKNMLVKNMLVKNFKWRAIPPHLKKP
jgi:hypothetical protein